MSRFWDSPNNGDTDSFSDMEREVVNSTINLMAQESSVDTVQDDVSASGHNLSEMSLFDASLRLEQGQLYKLLLSHSFFDGIDADPRAISIVENELKRFIKIRLEVLVGLRPDPLINLGQKATEQNRQSDSAFSDEEILLLKQFISRALSKLNVAETPNSNKTRLKPIESKIVTERNEISKINNLFGNKNPADISLDRGSAGTAQETKHNTPNTATVNRNQDQLNKKTASEQRLTKRPQDMTKEELINFMSGRPQNKFAIPDNYKSPLGNFQAQLDHAHQSLVTASAEAKILAKNLGEKEGIEIIE